MNPMLHQGRDKHSAHENQRENDPVVERRPKETGRQSNHRAAPGRESHKVLHAGIIPGLNGIR